jgi:hypothetical protein
MSPGLAWMAAFGNDKFGVSEGVDSTAGDAAALVMLGLVVVVVGLVAAFAISMARRARKPDQTLQFLDELDDGERPVKANGARPAAPPWQKPDDWWTKPAE